MNALFVIPVFVILSMAAAVDVEEPVSHYFLDGTHLIVEPNGKDYVLINSIERPSIVLTQVADQGRAVIAWPKKDKGNNPTLMRYTSLSDSDRQWLESTKAKLESMATQPPTCAGNNTCKYSVTKLTRNNRIPSQMVATNGVEMIKFQNGRSFVEAFSTQPIWYSTMSDFLLPPNSEPGPITRDFFIPDVYGFADFDGLLFARPNWKISVSGESVRLHEHIASQIVNQRLTNYLTIMTDVSNKASLKFSKDLGDTIIRLARAAMVQVKSDLVSLSLI